MKMRGIAGDTWTLKSSIKVVMLIREVKFSRKMSGLMRSEYELMAGMLLWWLWVEVISCMEISWVEEVEWVSWMSSSIFM